MEIERRAPPQDERIALFFPPLEFAFLSFLAVDSSSVSSGA